MKRPILALLPGLAAAFAQPALTRPAEAQPAEAQPAEALPLEPMGEIHATFRGEALDFFTWLVSDGDDVVSTATVVTIRHGNAGLPPMRNLFLTGATGPGGRDGVIHLGHDYGDTPQAGTTAPGSRVSTVGFWPEGMRAPYWEAAPDSPGGNADITLTRHEFDGESGHVAGRFNARLCRIDEIGGEADPEDCHEMSGSFDTPIHAQRD